MWEKSKNTCIIYTFHIYALNCEVYLKTEPTYIPLYVMGSTTMCDILIVFTHEVICSLEDNSRFPVQHRNDWLYFF